MSVDVDTQPVGLDIEDDDMVHTFCCNPHRTLCGEEMDEVEWLDDVDSPDCVVCLDLQNKPCGALLCRFRQWWRDRKSPP